MSESTHLTDERKNLEQAASLYAQVKEWSEDWQKVDETRAEEIIELAKSAIELFGHTNHDKKVELKRILDRADRIITPESLESLKKKAERIILQLIYPKNPKLRNIILFTIGAVVLLTLVLPLLKELSRLPVIQTTPPRTEVGIIGHWKGDGNTYDSIGNNHGNPIGTAYGLSKFGQAFSFDGDDRIEIPANPALGVTGELSISVWVKPTHFNGYQGFVCKYNAPDFKISYYLGTHGRNAQVEFSVFQNGNSDVIRGIYTRNNVLSQDDLVVIQNL